MRGRAAPLGPPQEFHTQGVEPLEQRQVEDLRASAEVVVHQAARGVAPARNERPTAAHPFLDRTDQGRGRECLAGEDQAALHGDNLGLPAGLSEMDDEQLMPRDVGQCVALLLADQASTFSADELALSDLELFGHDDLQVVREPNRGCGTFHARTLRPREPWPPGIPGCHDEVSVNGRWTFTARSPRRLVRGAWLREVPVEDIARSAGVTLGLVHHCGGFEGHDPGTPTDAVASVDLATTTTTRTSLPLLRELVAGGRLVHDGGTELAAQVDTAVLRVLSPW